MVHVWETHSYHLLKNLYELRPWDKRIHLYPPQTSHISATRKQSPDSVGTSQRNQVGEVLRVSAPRDTVSLCPYPLEAGLSLEIKLKNNFCPWFAISHLLKVLVWKKCYQSSLP